MASLTDIVFMGVKAGMALAQRGRQAYVDAAASRELVLPLTKFNTSMSVGVARLYFNGLGKQHLAETEGLAAIQAKVDEGGELKEYERKEYIDAAIEFQLLDDVASGKITKSELHEQGLTFNALTSVVHIRQYARNKANPSLAQRAIGAIIDTGVELLRDIPQAVDENSATGRVLKGFLDSLDGVEFTSAGVGTMARELFVAAVETIGQNSSLLTGDSTVQNLVQVVSTGVVNDLEKRLADSSDNLVAQEKARDWGQLILRSVLSNAGEAVLANPSIMGVEGTAEQALVSGVGTSLLGAILDEDSVDLSALLSRNSVDKLVKSALGVFAEHPELAGIDNDGLKAVISQTAKSLADNKRVLGRDMLPDVIRLVLEKTGKNAALLAPDGFSEGGKQLAVLAAGQILEQIAREPDGGAGWSPNFSKSQLTSVLDSVLDEVVENPDWLLEKAGSKSSMLKDALATTLDTLKAAPKNRLSADTGELVLRNVIKSVALRSEFLDEIPVGGETKSALSAALGALIDSTLSDDVDAKARWTLARGEVFGKLVETGMNKLAEMGITEGTIGQVVGVVDLAAAKLGAGDSFSLQGVLDQINALTAPAQSSDDQ